MNKFGFILPPGSRFTGASALNRDIYNYLKKEIDISALKPDTDFYYKVHIVGSLLNYFSLYKVADQYEYIMGTSFATLPFLNKAKIIQHFHSIDTASYKNVLESIKKQNKKEKKVMDRWLNLFDNIFEEKIEDILPRLVISEATESVCAQNAEKIIVVSPVVKTQLVKLFKIKSDKIKVILNGIPDYWFDNEKTDFVEKTSIVFPTRINYTMYTFLEKGQDRAFEILSKIDIPKKIYLHFGTCTEEFKKRYQKIIMDKTSAKIINDMNREMLQKEYQPGQILLSTSRTEACQLTLIEGMASKMIPVTYPIGIAPYVIKNGENGYIVNSAKEAIAIIKKLNNDSMLRKKIGQNARKTAEKYFTFDKMINQYSNILKQIIK